MKFRLDEKYTLNEGVILAEADASYSDLVNVEQQFEAIRNFVKDTLSINPADIDNVIATDGTSDETNKVVPIVPGNDTNKIIKASINQETFIKLLNDTQLTDFRSSKLFNDDTDKLIAQLLPQWDKNEKTKKNIGEFSEKLTNIVDNLVAGNLAKAKEAANDAMTLVQNQNDGSDISTNTNQQDWKAQFKQAQQKGPQEVVAFWKKYYKATYGTLAPAINTLGEAVRIEAEAKGFTEATNPFIKYAKELFDKKFLQPQNSDNKYIYGVVHNLIANERNSSTKEIKEWIKHPILNKMDFYKQDPEDAQKILTMYDNAQSGRTNEQGDKFINALKFVFLCFHSLENFDIKNIQTEITNTESTDWDENPSLKFRDINEIENDIDELDLKLKDAVGFDANSVLALAQNRKSSVFNQQLACYLIFAVSKAENISKLLPNYSISEEDFKINIANILNDTDILKQIQKVTKNKLPKDEDELKAFLDELFEGSESETE